MSGDGRYVAYTAQSGEPLPLPPGAAGTNLYVRDRLTNTLSRVVIPGHGEGSYSSADAPILDGNGRHLVFFWSDPVLGLGSYVQDRRTGNVRPVSLSTDGRVVIGIATSISGDGRFVSFTATASDVVPGSTNHHVHLFVRDLVADTTRWVSVDASGVALPGDYSGRVSGDGSTVVLWQQSSPSHVFRKVLASGAVQQVDVRGCAAQAPSSTYALASISDDGRTIAFQSATPTLMAGDTNRHDDVFVWRTTRPCSVDLVSRVRQGVQGNDDSYWPEVSGDGRALAFVSQASNLVAHDTDGVPGAFVRSLQLP